MTDIQTETRTDTLKKLAEPFEPAEVKWKPQVVKEARAMAIAYVDARVVMDRLDDVLGPGAWQDEYRVLDNGSVACRLACRLGGALGTEWVTKEDVGSRSEQDDEGDQMKAAFSDALKRAAVKYGIGRYLYRLPHQWVDYDPKKRQFARTPQLPAWALPTHTAPQKPAPAPEWKAKVEACQGADELNRLLPELRKLPPESKAAAWEFTKAFAHAHDLQWHAEQTAFLPKTSEAA